MKRRQAASPRHSDLQAMPRFEWERLVRRCQLGSSAAKLVAAHLAQYASRDGSRVRPGNRRLAATTELNERTVRRALDLLRSLGLIECVFLGSSSGRRALVDEYRLTIPPDLIERVAMLEPDETTVGTRPTDPGDEQWAPDPLMSERINGHERPGSLDIGGRSPDMESPISGHHALPPEHHQPPTTRAEHHSASPTPTRPCSHGEPRGEKWCALCRHATAPWDQPRAAV